MTSRIPVVFVATVVLFSAGCRQAQRQEPPNEKQARLLAAQSDDLRKALAAKDAEIAALRNKHAQHLQQRDEELAGLQARVKALQKEIDKGIAERVGSLTTAIMDDNARLRREIEGLKAQIEDARNL